MTDKNEGWQPVAKGLDRVRVENGWVYRYRDGLFFIPFFSASFTQSPSVHQPRLPFEAPSYSTGDRDFGEF